MALNTSNASTAISNSTRGGLPLAMFGSLFALAGAGLLIPLFLLPMIHVVGARSWPATPCTILHSEVLSHRGTKSDSTYSIDITFAYKFHGTAYIGRRYDFSVGSSSGGDYRQAIVRRLHPGAHAICYVDPALPTNAVIDRGLPRDSWFAVIPLAFFAVGMSIIIFAVRNAHPRPITCASAGSIAINREHLKESQPPLTKLVTIGIVALFWNGIISVFIYHAFSGNAGPIEWILRVFMIPFVIVGVFLIIGWFLQLIALFDPRPHLSLSNPAIALGQPNEARWTFSGNISRIKGLTVLIEGTERETHQSGENSRTDSSTFARIDVADTARPMDIAAGRAAFTIPPTSMHSFNAGNSKIVWAILVRAQIGGRRKAESEFPITVGPQPRKPVQH